MTSHRPSARFAAAAAVAIAATAAVLTGPASPAVARPAPVNQEYVALGDSFAAGPGVLPVDPDHLLPCLRSTNDYPHLVAKALDVEQFRDVTCSGATTANVLTTPQSLGPGLSAPVQLDAVSKTTTLVTLTIGANDLGLASKAVTCINLLPAPAGTSCRDTMTAGGVDQGAEAVDGEANAIARTLDAIHAKAPHARIVVTSYGNYLQHDGCYPIQPVWSQDANYLQGIVDRLGKVTQRVAASHHAEYVDLIGPGAGHDGCQLTQNWVTVVVPGTTLGLVPFHPTLLGEQNFARLVVGHLAGASST